GDHILGVGIMARKYGLPVYIHPDTLKVSAHRVGWIPEVIPLQTSCPLTVGNMTVTPFAIPHDAVNPFGFTFSANGKKLGLATDMGTVSALVRERLRECQALILESNHDLQMLREGPYAWSLKQRVMSRHGHLSNGDSSDLLRELIHDRLESVVLAHISQVNNNLHLAYGAAESVVRGSGWDIELFAARQDEVGTCIEVARSGQASGMNQPLITP
ncbi:MAG: MBL fold metallo-hydrolase, partial [bacterium]|nr:MBL fold metallo-hydrolase [bacterium]